jgi:putative sterol carrier protein
VQSARSARELFDLLARRLHDTSALLPQMACRFDVAGVASWRISVDRGRVAVKESRERADLALQLPEELLLEIVSGKKNLLAAIMRGEVVVDGDMAYAPALLRLLRSRAATVERQIGK